MFLTNWFRFWFIFRVWFLRRCFWCFRSLIWNFYWNKWVWFTNNNRGWTRFSLTLLLMSLLDDTLYTVPIFNDISCVVDDTFTDLFSNKIMVSVSIICQKLVNTEENEVDAHVKLNGPQNGQSWARLDGPPHQSEQYESKWTLIRLKVNGLKVLKWTVENCESGRSKILKCENERSRIVEVDGLKIKLSWTVYIRICPSKLLKMNVVINHSWWYSPAVFKFSINIINKNGASIDFLWCDWFFLSFFA